MITNSDLRIGNYFKTGNHFYQISKITGIGIESCNLYGMEIQTKKLVPIKLTSKIISMIKGFDPIDTGEVDYIEKIDVPKEDIHFSVGSSVYVSGCMFNSDGNITHYKKSKYHFMISLPNFLTIHFNSEWEKEKDPSLVYIVGDGFEVESTYTPIVYLHQLQNLYHSLTGEELEIDIP
jgi:hypothetical protein